LSQPPLDLNVRDRNLRTPLHFAVLNRNLPAVRGLLNSSSINVNARDVDFNTALHYAVIASDLEMVTLLLSIPSIQLNVRNRRWENVFHIAVRRNDDLVLRALLDGRNTDAAYCCHAVDQEGKHLFTMLLLITILKSFEC
jgi:ankyrin repeat protein